MTGDVTKVWPGPKADAWWASLPLALREALQTAITDSALRARLSDASWLAGQGLPRWRDGAELIARVLHSTAGAAS